MSTEKTLDVQSIEDAKAKVSDIKAVGNGDTFTLLCKASSKEQGWMKSAKAMEVPGGAVVQVTTQQDGNVAEAVTFVPGVKIVEGENGGRTLVAKPTTTKAIAFQTAGEPVRLVVLTVDSIKRVVCDTPGSPTTLVDGTPVRGTIEEVLAALGWDVKPVEKIPVQE